MPQKILLIRFSSIGDIIITTPIIKSLREKFPHAQIDYLTKKKFAPLLENNPDLSKIWEYDKRETSLSQQKKALKAEKYDLVIDLHNSLRSRILRLWLAKKVLVYAKPYFRRLLLTKFGINFLQDAKPIYQRYYQACKALKLKEYRNYFVHYLPTDAQKIENLVTRENFVLVSLSAAHFTKKWQLEKFAEVIERLSVPQVIVLGGKQEQKEAERLKNICASPEKILNLCGQLDLLQTAALFAKSKLLICHDSGLLHLAQSQNLACVAIFGCTSKELGFFPINENCVVVQADVSCRPCTAKGLAACPRGHFRCMREISVEMVLEQAERLL